MSRPGPGLLLRDIVDGDEQAHAAAEIVAHIAPDILLLTEFDYDHGLAALSAFAELTGSLGQPYPHRFALMPNSGMATELDLDGDGHRFQARDAQGYGHFSGDGGLALLSVHPIDTEAVQDFSDLLWQHLPGAEMPVMEDGTPFPSAMAQALRRLSSTGHWVVPVEVPRAGTVTVMAFGASPPVFDGAEDSNGMRNADEIRFWQHFLDGAFGPPPEARFVLMGNANLDPIDGDGRHEAIVGLLSDPRLQDPEPRATGWPPSNDPDQRGDPALDTADWESPGPGNLRVSYVLPSSDWQVLGTGVFWPNPLEPMGRLLGDDGMAAGPHRIVWVDLAPP